MTNGPDLLVVATIYLGGHFLLYALALRKLRAMASESAVFLYHTVPFLLSSIAALRLAPEGGIIYPFIAIGLHGLYSLSFLEIWSLTEGSFSLSILREIQRASASGTDADLRLLTTIGSRKLYGRLEALLKFGLVTQRGDQLGLS